MEIVELYWGAKMLILIVGLILLYYWIMKIILIMAEKHILIMKRKNGTAVPIYAKGGGIIEISVLYYGHDYDEKTGEITKKEIVEIKKDDKFISFIKSFFWIEGLYWLGITRESRKKTKKWLEYKLKPGGKFEINERTEEQDFVWLKDDVYPVLIPNIELKGMGAVDVILLFYIRAKNPNKTLRVENWLTALLEIASSSAKDQLETLSYEEITGKSEEEEEEYEKDEDKKEDQKQGSRIALLAETRKTKIAESLFENLEAMILELKDTYGGEIFKIKMPSIELSGPMAKEYQQASILGYQTKKQASRIRELAQARRDEIKTVYQEVHQWKHGLDILKQETIQKAGEQGNTVIIPMDFKGNILIDTSKSKKGNRKEETK